MGKETIEKTIRGYIKKNHDDHPGAFPKTLSELVQLSKLLADTYWENRYKTEVQRDNEAEVTILDYEKWCIAELLSIKNESLFN